MLFNPGIAFSVSIKTPSTSQIASIAESEASVTYSLGSMNMSLEVILDRVELSPMVQDLRLIVSAEMLYNSTHSPPPSVLGAYMNSLITRQFFG